jgi:cysteinyl-tRNA synthetase
VVKALLAQERASQVVQHNYNTPEKELVAQLLESQRTFRAALCDSFNTPEALEILLKLISKTNIYISTQKSSKIEANPEVLRKIATWITKMLRMFGLGEGPELQAIGWGEVASDGSAVQENVSQLLCNKSI